VGVAISEAGQIARPLCTIKNKGHKKVIATLRDLATRHCGSMYDILPVIVVGIPYLKDGALSDIAHEVHIFAKSLKEAFGDVNLYNEFLSSVDAEEYIRYVMRITDYKKIKELVDGVAASMILQRYLTELKGETNGKI
jgi:putative transcription antitermination factor YqgF